MIRRAIPAVLLMCSFLVACESAPEEIPEDLSQAEFFQRAQDEYDAERWDSAVRYYETFIERFPDAIGAHVEARYEIALITYRRGDPAGARVLFAQLLAEYDAPEALLPEWPRVLAEILVEEIDAAETRLLETEAE